MEVVFRLSAFPVDALAWRKIDDDSMTRVVPTGTPGKYQDAFPD
jgi:hypothetical protein